MRVLVAGASGLIGTRLVPALRQAGHDVLRLVRRRPAAPDERGWDPPAGHVDAGTFDGVDAVVNLGGVGIGDRPWSGARKQAVRDSRNVPTDVLARAVAEHGIGVLVTASAVGYYGDAGDRAITESAPPGRGFLAEVCADWEAAAAPAAAAGARVVVVRTGQVLAPAGGVLARMRPLFRLFLGVRFGSGRQYVPWVSIDDEVGAIRFALENDTLAGPVNVTGPTPVTNREFARTLAAALHRPEPLVAVPAPVIRTVLGDMGEEFLLFGQRAVPQALLDAGYPFCHHTLAEALATVVRTGTAG